MLNTAIRGDAGKPFLHMPCETVHPNKFSGSYIISLVLGLARAELRAVDFTAHKVTKIYRRHQYSYICPQIGEAPPEGYRWIEMGHKYSRTIYRAI